MTHSVPDPPTQSGCTSCGNDLHHGLVRGDRVVMIAPATARQAGVISGFALDKADVVVDGRTYPTTIHAKWLEREELVPMDAVCIVCPHGQSVHFHQGDGYTESCWCRVCNAGDMAGPCSYYFIGRHEYNPTFRNSANNGALECHCKLAEDSEAHQRPFYIKREA